MRDISIADARWIGGLLARLSDAQIQDAFRAANYTPEQVRMLSGAVRKRINQLVNLQHGAATSAHRNTRHHHRSLSFGPTRFSTPGSLSS
jgi:hypothetical protein